MRRQAPVRSAVKLKAPYVDEPAVHHGGLFLNKKTSLTLPLKAVPAPNGARARDSVTKRFHQRQRTRAAPGAADSRGKIEMSRFSIGLVCAFQFFNTLARRTSKERCSSTRRAKRFSLASEFSKSSWTAFSASVLADTSAVRREVKRGVVSGSD